VVAVEEDGDSAAGVGSADGDESSSGEVDVAVVPLQTFWQAGCEGMIGV